MTTDGAHDPKRRVLLSDMSRILAAIVRDLVGRQPDLVWVGHAAGAELTTTLRSLRPDVLVLAAPRSDRDRAEREELRRSVPDLTVVELRPRDDRAMLWRPRSGLEPILSCPPAGSSTRCARAGGPRAGATRPAERRRRTSATSHE